ncbi:MAG TPA: response regulator transcription factor [Fimbriimonadaceae bacterium]|nr:response regulator transcription factor [Fimbriimonadaceae bacterium]
MALIDTFTTAVPSTRQMKVLVIDDEPAIVETIETKLRKEGFTVFTAESAEDGMRLVRRVKPDLLVLDIMLPQRSGLELCRAIRRESSTPIIFLSAKAAESDRVRGLELGGDDYIVKPFNLNELVARVRAVLRRASGDQLPEIVERGNLKVDPRRHEAWIDGKLLELSPREFALLHFLMRNAGQVFSREILLDRVWGKDAFVSSRTVDVHVRWLRTRVETDPNEPERILTVRGIGYKFVG